VGLAFRDFCPRRTQAAGLFSSEDYESFDVAVEAASLWIDATKVQVVNVETVVLPNIHAEGEQGSTDSHLRASGKLGTYWYQFVRVWYAKG
jgi:hypothetical protein